MAPVLSVLFCLASGFVFISLAWSRAPLLADFLLRLSLAGGFGLGIFSVVFFLARVSGVTNLLPIDIGIVLLLLVAQLLFRKKSDSQSPVVAQDAAIYPAWFRSALTASFAMAVAAALYAAILRTLAHPHGDGWDAFSIWNLHARFLGHPGPGWRDGFTSLIPWSHPDYPLLTPAATAHFWSYLGRDAVFVPAAIGVVFIFATAGVLFGALSALRGPTQAILATIALLATPAFIEQGTAQYADVPLSFFLLSTVALLGLRERRTAQSNNAGLLVLSGIAAGFAAWTKNEGLLFVLAIVLARALASFFPSRNGFAAARYPKDLWQSSAPLFAGLVPVLIVVAYFKHALAAPGDLFTQPGTILHKLLSPGRYWAIIQWYGKGFLRFGRWLFIPGTLLLAGLHFAADGGNRPLQQPALRTSVLALILTLAGYFAVYLITPYDIYWHLRFSLNRLFLQLWPSAIFLFFSAIPAPVSARREVKSQGVPSAIVP